MKQRQGEGQRLRVEAIPGAKPPWGLWLVLSLCCYSPYSADRHSSSAFSDADLAEAGGYRQANADNGVASPAQAWLVATPSVSGRTFAVV
jgi:hypothetical protein